MEGVFRHCVPTPSRPVLRELQWRLMGEYSRVGRLRREEKKECRWGFVLDSGTRSFCCCPLVDLAVVLGILSANVSTSPILILYSIVTLYRCFVVLSEFEGFAFQRVILRSCTG